MVKGEAERDLIARSDAAVGKDGRKATNRAQSEDRGFGKVDDGIERADSKRSQICDGKHAAAKVFRRQVSPAGAVDESPGNHREFSQGKQIYPVRNRDQ